MFKILRISNLKNLKQLKKKNKLLALKNNQMIYKFKKIIIIIKLKKKLNKMNICKKIRILILIMIHMKAFYK